ncbi:hypothetical protein G5714_020090 [Onychostoma macrolepis]|uniref:Iodothyronine deiodinase n=1 Tax=Onychostoma macrolepis TaxID=369639 RepID=A0A7J6BYR8_9TELE|nr:hypothetical protein G5714_020090 [Onychostoma macrolepis]
MNREAQGSAVVVDTMENSSNSAYGAYFERLYILKDERVVYQGGRGPEGYRISELRDWLERYRSDLEASKAATVVHLDGFGKRNRGKMSGQIFHDVLVLIKQDNTRLLSDSGSDPVGECLV